MPLICTEFVLKCFSYLFMSSAYMSIFNVADSCSFLSSDAKDRRCVIPVSVLQFETDMVSVILLLILVSSLQDHAKVSFYSV